MKHSFGPISDVIEAWCLSFVPEETFIGLIPDIPSSCLVIPRQEFFNHPLYRRPDITNLYVTWQMDQDVTYVIHAFSSCLKELQEHVKTRLLEFQVTIHRGLVLPISVEQMKRLSNETIVEKDGTHLIVLHSKNWNALDIEIRHSLLLDYGKEWDRWEAGNL